MKFIGQKLNVIGNVFSAGCWQLAFTHFDIEKAFDTIVHIQMFSGLCFTSFRYSRHADKISVS